MEAVARPRIAIQRAVTALPNLGITPDAVQVWRAQNHLNDRYQGTAKMSYLIFEAAQARIADIHREAELRRRAALARSNRRRTARWRHALRPRFAWLQQRRRSGERSTRPAGMPS
jgi:hypothetical protein